MQFAGRSFAFGFLVALLIAMRVSAQADADADGVADTLDNCVNHLNATQLDTDCDGYGDRCDADFNNDNVVSLADYGMILAATGTTSLMYDVAAPYDGVKDAADEAHVFSLASQVAAPGPSGGAPPGAPSCAVSPPPSGPIYCVSGTPTGANYAWQLALGGTPLHTETPVVGSLGNAPVHLMLNLAWSLEATSGWHNVDVTGVRLSAISGGFDCFSLSNPLVTLSVGPPNNPVACAVTNLAGCVFNPLLFLAGPKVPALPPGAVLSLAALLCGAGAYAIRRRRTRRR